MLFREDTGKNWKIGIKFNSENLNERNHLKKLGIDVRIIPKWILKKYGLGTWIGLIWLRIG
jgi:hypothetical protein